MQNIQVGDQIKIKYLQRPDFLKWHVVEGTVIKTDERETSPQTGDLLFVRTAGGKVAIGWQCNARKIDLRDELFKTYRKVGVPAARAWKLSADSLHQAMFKIGVLSGNCMADIGLGKKR
jgi:hypothetical protein